MCTDGQPRTSSMDVLCVLTDTHGRPVCVDGHTHTRTHTDSHRRPVFADGQPRMSCVCWRTPTEVVSRHTRLRSQKGTHRHGKHGQRNLPRHSQADEHQTRRSNSDAKTGHGLRRGPLAIGRTHARTRQSIRTVSLPTLETAQPEVGSSGWKSTARRVVSGAFPAAPENLEDRMPLTPVRTHNRLRSPR
ncbi:unnamed protein product [Brassica rapa subsp. narinosa]